MAQGVILQIRKGGNKCKLAKFDERFIQKNKCAIKVNSCITCFEYSKGVRQGCPLSSFLFNLYVNDIFDTIEDHSTSDVI